MLGYVRFRDSSEQADACDNRLKVQGEETEMESSNPKCFGRRKQRTQYIYLPTHLHHTCQEERERERERGRDSFR